MARNPAYGCTSAPIAFSLSHPCRFDLWAAEVLCEELYRQDRTALCHLRASSAQPGPISVTGWISCASYPWRDADPVSILKDRIILRFGAGHPLAARAVSWSVNTVIEPVAARACRNAAGMCASAESLPERLNRSAAAECALKADLADPVRPLILVPDEAGVLQSIEDPEGRAFRGNCEQTLLAASAEPQFFAPACGLEKTSPERVLNAFVRFVAQTLTALGICERCTVTAAAAPGSDRITSVRIRQTGARGASSRAIEREILSWDLSFGSLFQRLRLDLVSLPYALERFMTGWPAVFRSGIGQRPMFCDSEFFEQVLGEGQDETEPGTDRPEADCRAAELTDCAMKIVIGDATAADLVCGIDLEAEVTYESEDGSVWACTLAAATADSADLIDQQNHAGTAFMQELPSIQVESAKLEAIRSGKALENILTGSEKKQIRNLVRDSVALSVAYGESTCIWKKPVRESRELGIRCDRLRTHEEELLDCVHPAVRHLRDVPDAAFLRAAHEYEEKLGTPMPQWLRMLPGREVSSALALSLRHRRALPGEPPTERARNLWSAWVNSGRRAADFVRDHLAEDIREILRTAMPGGASRSLALCLASREKDYRMRCGKELPQWTRALDGNVRLRVIDAALEAECPLPDASPVWRKSSEMAAG